MKFNFTVVFLLAFWISIFSDSNVAAKADKPRRRIQHRRFDRHNSIKKLSEFFGELNQIESQKEIDNLTCDQAMDRIFYRLPSIGGIFYVVSSPWAIGNWGDYDTCTYDAFDS